jgi:hypothetical protein
MELQHRINRLNGRIRVTMVMFIVLLILSGLTAIPVQTELNFLVRHIHRIPLFMQEWVRTVSHAINDTATHYPYLLYGYDWLAYGHIVIALFFFGVYRDPIGNAWVLRTGMVACLGIFILAFAVAALRGIPLFWSLIDCAFGVFGILPLLLVQRWINQLRILKQTEFTNSHHSL